MEDHPQEDLEVRAAIHPEHQYLPRQDPQSKEANNPLQEQLMLNLWEDCHKSSQETALSQISVAAT